jgi:hypothetical protein
MKTTAYSPARSVARASSPFAAASAVDRVVLDDEHAEPVSRALRRRGRGRGRGRRVSSLEDELQPKTRASPRRAIEAELSAHQLGEAAADREAEARAAEAASRRAVGLGEGDKQPPGLLARDPNAGVADGELDLDGAFVERPDPEQRLDLAALRELHRVREHVQQNLPQARGIAERAQPGGLGGIRRQPQALLGGGGGDERHGVGQDGRGLHARALDRHALRLDFREVEHVVDEVEETVSRARERLDALLLARVEPRAAQQPGRADDGVQGRAQLVAHVRHELPFHALRFHERGEIAERDGPADRRAVEPVRPGDALEDAPVLQPKNVASLTDPEILVAQDALAAEGVRVFHQGRAELKQGRPVVDRDDIGA